MNQEESIKNIIVNGKVKKSAGKEEAIMVGESINIKDSIMIGRSIMESMDIMKIIIIIISNSMKY